MFNFTAAGAEFFQRLICAQKWTIESWTNFRNAILQVITARAKKEGERRFNKALKQEVYLLAESRYGGNVTYRKKGRKMM